MAPPVLTGTTSGWRRYVTAAAWIVFVVTPAHIGGLIHGIPLGGVETCALLAIVWLTARGRRIGGASLVAAVAVVAAALAIGLPADRGFRARYFANADARPPFERSTEVRSRSYTRVDDRLDFAPHTREFPLAFFNDIVRFNVPTADEPSRDRLSFSVYWEGLWFVPDASTRTLFVDAPGAAAQIIVDDNRLLAVKPGDGVATGRVDLAAGWHRLEIRFSSPYGSPRRFSAGEMIGDRRAPFDANAIVTRAMVPWEMRLARAAGAVKTVVDLCALAWLTLLVVRELAAMARRQRADGVTMSHSEYALSWFGVVALVDAYVVASPWLDRFFLLGAGDDPLTYEHYAREIQLNGLLLRGIDGPYYYQVFYPYFLAAVHTVFGEGMFGVMLVQRLLVALAVWMCVDMAARIGGERTWPAALTCGLLVAYAKLAPIAASPLNESLFVPLLVTWSAAAVRLAQAPTRRRAIVTGLLGGLTALTRTTALLGWPPVFVLLWMAWKPVAARARLLATVAVCSLAVVSLISIRNWIVLHRFIPMPTEFGITLVTGNEPPRNLPLDYTRRGPLYDRLGFDSFTRQVVEYAITAPATFAANMGRKVLFALGLFEPYAPGWGYSILFIALSVASVAGFVVALRAGVAPPAVVWVPAVIALSQFAAVVAVYPKGARLILPFHMVLIPYAAIAVERSLRLRQAITPPTGDAHAGTTARRIGAAAALVFVGVFTFAIRTRGVSEHFLMLGDQIRDWSIALGPFSRLPLVGTPSTAGGNSFGPVFYWVLWVIRVIIGPFFDNLPHAGGIGLAAIASIGDGVLCAGIRRATGSWLFAVATVIIVASSPFDLALSSVIWNPVLSVALTKIAAGLVLYWGDALTTRRRILLAAASWLAVQAHSAALPFSAAIFLWMFWNAWQAGPRRVVVVAAQAAAVVLLLQLPSFFARESIQPTKLWALALHPEQLRPLDAFRALCEAVASIAAAPFQLTQVPLLLIGAAVALLVGGGEGTGGPERTALQGRTPPIVFVTVVPLAIAVGLWSLWQGEAYEAYAFLTLAPPAVLLVAWLLQLPQERASRTLAAAALLVAALVMLPARRENATLVFRQPSYGALVRGSRTLAARGEPLRRIEAPFLPPLSNAEFVYTILGGTISRDSQVVAHLTATGEVTYDR